MAEAQEGVSYEAVKEFIKNMSLMDAAKLVQELEEELGVSAAAPVAMVAGGAAAGAAPAEQAEEKTEFSLSLDEIGSEKIKVIKVVREITGLGLKEAKETVESAPKIIKEGLSKEDAEAAKKKLEEVGAKVSLK